MSHHLIAQKGITARLIGATCTKVERSDEAETWTFTFGDGQAGLVVSCPWRILAAGRIALAHQDHGHQFGLPAPVDGIVEGERLLSGKPVTAVLVHQDTADLTITFGGLTALEPFNNSSGYEGWNVGASDGFQAFALGGGGVEIFPERPPKRPAS